MKYIEKCILNKNNSNLKKIFTIISTVVLLIGLLYPELLSKLYIPLLLLSLIIGVFSIPYTFLIIILSYTRFFCVINIPESLPGSINDFAIVAVMASVMSFCIKKIFLRNNKVKIRNIFILIIIIITIISGVMGAYINVGQPIINGILSSRVYLIILFVFPFSDYIKKYRNLSDFLQTFNILLLGIQILIIIQYYLLNNIMFLGVPIAMRSGELRLIIHAVSPLICINIAYNLDRLIFNSKVLKEKFFYGLSIVISMYLMIVVVRTRIFLFSIIIIFILETFILNKRISRNTKIMLVICSIIILLILLLTPVFTKTINNIFGDVLRDGRSYIRFEAIKFYNSLIKNKFFGGGIVNSNYINSPINMGEKYGYFISDLGIYGYYFEFGIIGIITMIMFIIYCIKKILGCNINNMYSRVFINIFAIIISTLATVKPFEFYMLPFVILILSIPLEKCFKIRQFR